MDEELSDETVEAIKEFGGVLQRIHNRLVGEGKIIKVDEHHTSRWDETDMQKPFN